MTGFMIFCGVLLLFNCDGTFRFFALYNGVIFAMMFVDPSTNAGADVTEVMDADVSARDWSAVLQGAVLSNLSLYAIGAIFAMLIPLITPAVTAIGGIYRVVETCAQDLQETKKYLVLLYRGDAATQEYQEVYGKLKAIDEALDGARALKDTAWWECFGFGKTGQMLKRVGKLLDIMTKGNNDLRPLLSVITRETFDKSHQELMSGILQPLAAVLLDLQALTAMLVKWTLDVSKEDAARRIEISAQQAKLNSSVMEVTKVMREKAGDPSFETTGEYHFVYSVCHSCRRWIKYAEGLDKDEPAAAGPTKWIDWDSTLEKEHLLWAFRNCLSLFICFWIGFFGWSPGCLAASKADPTVTCFINPHNPGLALIVVILMSKSVGSTIRAALGRISAVVLASITGQVLYILYGYCEPYGRFMTGVSVLVLVQPMAARIVEPTDFDMRITTMSASP